MKNIHLIPTENPSSLFEIDGHLIINKEQLIQPKYYRNIYITNSEEIKEGVDQWYLDKVLNEPYNSGGAQYSSKQDVIILTTDQDLIKDGVRAIDDEFLEWFVKNPSCERVEVEIKPMFPMYSTFIESIDNPPFYGNLKRKIIIPQEEPKQENCCTPVGQIKRYVDCVGCDRKPKQETLEKYSNGLYKQSLKDDVDLTFSDGVKLGAKWQAKRMYSEEEVGELVYKIMGEYANKKNIFFKGDLINNLFEQFKKK